MPAGDRGEFRGKAAPKKTVRIILSVERDSALRGVEDNELRNRHTRPVAVSYFMWRAPSVDAPKGPDGNPEAAAVRRADSSMGGTWDNRPRGGLGVCLIGHDHRVAGVLEPGDAAQPHLELVSRTHSPIPGSGEGRRDPNADRRAAVARPVRSIV